MKSNILHRAISVLLCLLTVISIMSVTLTANARYADDFNGTYDDLNCAEDDCDCLEPDNNRFAIVSPSSKNNTHNTIVLTGTYEEVQNYFKSNGQTDGLPVIPPTKLKAEKFMRYTSHNDNDVIATVNGRQVTAYQVAVNAIMSGSSAEYMPVCIAFTKALGNVGYFDSIKSGKLTPMMYVNGPIARQLGIDNAQGMTTEECNIAIARFMELALINLAGIKRTNAFGNVQPLVFSENEEVCLNVGWEPHHVEEGYALNDSTITATSFSMWGNNVTPATDLPEEIMKVIAWDITEKNLGGLGSASSKDNADTKRLIFITESVATALATKYKTKEALENALVENARRPLWMRTYAYYYANTGSALTKSFSDVYNELKSNSLEDAKLTASPAWMNGITYANIETVATMKKGNTDIIITGDSSRNKTQVMPGGVAVTQKIELPSAWDSLMTSMSYQALDTFCISKVDNSVTVPTADAIPAVLIPSSNTATWRIVASSNYVSRQNTMYYNATTYTLYYWDKTASAQATITLDNNTYSDFIALVQGLSSGSSFTVSNRKLITKVNIAFSSNASLPDKNMVSFTSNSFGTIVPTIVATTSTNPSRDGSTITMNDTVTTFTADLGGDIVMGDSTDAKFVTISGSTVTVNPTVPAGATAVIGASDGNGTYRTMTIVNGGDGTYKITYNTANTLTLASSAFYLKGTFNNWGITDAFVKTDNDDILVITKEISAGTYSFKVHDVGTNKWYGNSGTINNTANRWILDSSTDCTFVATGGKYEFKYEISTNRLSVYFAQTDTNIVVPPTTKTVYVGVIEYITGFVPTLHYWNNSTGLVGDAKLTSTGETVQYAVGSAYWNNAKQKFNVYKTEIPVEANGMKTYRKLYEDLWAAEDITYAEDQILLVFEWGGIYHNVTDNYVVEEPTQPPTEPESLLGDVNNDGVVNITDATLIQMYLVEMVELTNKQLELADTDKDSVVSIRDATLIQMYAAQIITKF